MRQSRLWKQADVRHWLNAAQHSGQGPVPTSRVNLDVETNTRLYLQWTMWCEWIFAAQVLHCQLMSTCAHAWCSVLVGSESRQAHFLCQQFLLPPASPTMTHPAFAWQGVCGYTSARLRDVTRWLLQRSVRRGTKDGNTQASARAECRCTAHQRYPEIRPRTVTIDAPGFTLAWHSWASQLHTLSTDTSMSPREGSSVPIGLLHTSIPSCCTTTCVQPLVTGWWFRDIGSARTAVGHSLSLARWPSTLCPMSCATPPSTQQLSDDF